MEHAKNIFSLVKVKRSVILFMFLALSLTGLLAQTAVAPALGDGSAGNPYQIATLENLYWITQADGALNNKHYIQTADIDAADTINWDFGYYGKGWPGIGSGPRNKWFSGVYDGQGHVVSNLYIRDIPWKAGLFGATGDRSTGNVVPATIKNLGVINVDIVGSEYVGALVGEAYRCTIDNCWSTGTISTVTSNGSYKPYVGGLVGKHSGYSNETITNSWSSCDVSNGNAEDGGSYTGGLVGQTSSSMSNVCATGTVTAKDYVGGLVGYMQGNVYDSYAIGNVAGNDNVGGLVGFYGWSTLGRAYSSGVVSGNSNVGGLVGSTTSSNFTSCFWDLDNSEQTYSAGGIGKTTEEMKTMSTFINAGWGLMGINGTTWGMRPDVNTGYAFLAIQGYIQPCEVTSQSVNNVAETTATGHGTISNYGGPTISQHGFCWSTFPEPDISNDKSENGTATSLSNFSTSITGLQPYTLYYARAYATNADYTAYGEQLEFTTLPQLASVTTGVTTEIATTTATLNGNLTNLGAPNPTQHGFCWSTSPNPTISDNMNELGAASETGDFSSPITDLSVYETYYVRAYATNLAGTSYGNEIEFTTLGTPSAVTTQVVTDIQATIAIGNGTITELGIPNPDEYGLCWSTSQNPTIDDSKSTLYNATETGAFSTELTDLSPVTTYYVRAYATTAVETVYGNEVSFNTLVLDGLGTSDDPYIIRTLADLSYVSANTSLWNKHYIQATDIDASATNNGAGFSPIGNSGTKFTGTYNGQGHTISHLFISGGNDTGLFGYTLNATIQNLGLADCTISGHEAVGALIGQADATTVNNCFSTGIINATEWSSGGLIGLTASNTVISNSYSHSAVQGNNGVGGLVGNLTGSSVNKCYSTGSVSGSGTMYFGGLIGLMGTATNSFWDVDTSGQTSSAGGGGAVGKTTTEMKMKTNYTDGGWVFKTDTEDGTWNIGNGRNNGYPYLDWQFSDDPADNPPVISTQEITDITFESATGNGTIHYLGNAEQHGICWDITSSPTIADFITENGIPVQTGAYTSEIIDLEPETTYYVRAFASSAIGIVYGNEVEFITPEEPLIVSTQTTTDITATTAIGHGTISRLGKTNPTQHGHCWSTSPNPDINDSKTELGPKDTIGAFESEISELSVYTNYYIRAYATNQSGTVYGEQLEFTTLPELPAVTTISITDILSTTAIANGNLDELGTPNASQHGFCWNTSGSPTITDHIAELGEALQTGHFSTEISGLQPYTNYYIRAYALSPTGLVYGDELEFTTAALLATVSTLEATNITSISVTGNGNITDLGAPNPSQHGHYWSTSPNRMLEERSATKRDSRTSGFSELGEVSDTGTFISEITELIPYTTYYIKAYATNLAGTVYGDEVEFTTSAILPSVNIQSVTEITETSATVNGSVTELGIPNPSEHGFCWNITGSPTIADDKTEMGEVTATVDFISYLTGLSPYVTYYIRAYATNPAGTVYSDVIEFSTLAMVPTVSTLDVTEITATSATATGNIESTGGPHPNQHGHCWSIDPEPTIANDKTELGSIFEPGTFTSLITELSPYTSYFIRAYATNIAGTVYGEQEEFSTLPLAPVVTTQAVTNIGGTTATGNGTIEDLGVPNPSEYGVCYSTSPNPTIEQDRIILLNANQTGAFSCDIPDLVPQTTYYVKTYASNLAGTVYGNQVSFATTMFIGGGTAQSPYEINSLDDLRNLSENSGYWNKYFIQNANIDAMPTSGWNNGAGLLTIGNSTTKFTGNYNGQGHTISHLFISRGNYTGLFGYTISATIQNLGLVNCAISGGEAVGALIGKADATTVNNCFTTGSVNATWWSSGGLIGLTSPNTVISNSYSHCTVDGNQGVGGLAGNLTSSSVNKCYSTGSVSGSTSVGGLIGLQGTATNSFWDTETSGQSGSAGGTGKTNEEMKTQSTFAGWDFENIWAMESHFNNGYPSLIWQFSGKVADPTFSPDHDIFIKATDVSIETATEGATVMCRTTTDGETWSDWQVYTNPITVPVNTEMNFEAYAEKDDWITSDTAAASYTVTNPPLPAIAVYPLPDVWNIPIEAMVFGWSYDEDGTTPDGYMFKYWQDGQAQPEMIDVSAETIHTIMGVLDYDKVYNWQVIPYINATVGGQLNGSQYGKQISSYRHNEEIRSGDKYLAVDCPIWSFTTIMEPIEIPANGQHNMPDLGITIHTTELITVVALNPIIADQLPIELDQTFSFSVNGSGIVTITVTTTAQMGYYYFNNSWNPDPSGFPNVDGEISFSINFNASRSNEASLLVGNESDPDPPLPVTLNWFEVEYLDNQAVLSWQTASETNNMGWKAYRSQNSLEPDLLLNTEFIAGAGTTTQNTDYNYCDPYALLMGNTYFYWIESVEFDGTTELFGPVTLEVPIEGEVPLITKLLSNHPNPFNPNTNISFDVRAGETGILEIYDVRGRKLESHEFSAGSHNYLWQAEGKSSGIYFYRLKSESYRETKKMLLLK